MHRARALSTKISNDRADRLDFRRSLVSGLPSPKSSGRSAGSFPEQRLVIEPIGQMAIAIALLGFNDLFFSETDSIYNYLHIV